MLGPGDPAPDVSAPTQHGDRVSPDFEDPTVVYFYPEDGTPGCTTEAAQFQRERDVYEDAGVTVYGVSTDGAESHREFAERQGVEFDLLADPDGAVADAFGVELEQGRAPRSTFVLADARIEAVHENVDPDGHARDVMMELLEQGLAELDEH